MPLFRVLHHEQNDRIDSSGQSEVSSITMIRGGGIPGMCAVYRILHTLTKLAWMIVGALDTRVLTEVEGSLTLDRPTPRRLHFSRRSTVPVTILLGPIQRMKCFGAVISGSCCYTVVLYTYILTRLTALGSLKWPPWWPANRNRPPTKAS